MIARIGTWLFYAVVFFLLGVWSSSRLPSVSSFLDRQVAGAGHSAAPVADRVTKPQPPVVKPTQPPAAKPVADAAVADLEPARAAFARGDLKAAIEAYRGILASHPDDTTARGELGNVFFNAGRIDEAATTYHETAVRLIAAGQTAAARTMIPAVRRIQPALGDDLERRLSSDPAAKP
ncbi:tetratricopeptide repeat protein [Rhodobacter ferrooxidans]|uniref:Uncharacterized protein n=1 Tax=Rhodobacter ferrooxidans TaxID=371731 RepID=C8S1B7_9RHOB|nr:tetratricopeptide repeat protein [Rhodobacter sp. SW2]EEW25315.1 hypothetical protein Rsw2DRAFT_1845 [Rhodobacter sp. SW2]